MPESSFSIKFLLQKRLWHRRFPENFAKFLRTPFLKNISDGCFYVAFQYDQLVVKPFLYRLQLGFSWKKNISRKFVHSVVQSLSYCEDLLNVLSFKVVAKFQFLFMHDTHGSLRKRDVIRIIHLISEIKAPSLVSTSKGINQ